jgi:hypothetical protein
MTQEEVTKRPDIDAVARRFHILLDSFTKCKLRSRLRLRKDADPDTVEALSLLIDPPSGFVRHWWNRIGYNWRGIPPLPTRSRRPFM